MADDLTRQLAEARARIAELEAERAEIRRAERERCAQVCDRFNAEREWDRSALFDRGAKARARVLAAIIRALKDEDPS